jgi:hypothetical protein
MQCEVMPHSISHIQNIAGMLGFSDTDRTDTMERWNIIVQETD